MKEGASVIAQIPLSFQEAQGPKTNVQTRKHLVETLSPESEPRSIYLRPEAPTPNHEACTLDLQA